MANTKISALPSYTGTAADLRWFVMNNSGETETYKFSGYTSPLKQVGTSILPLSSPRLVNNIVLIGDNSTIDNDFRFDSISIGTGNQIRGPRAVGIGCNQTQLVDDCVYIGNGASGSGNGGVIAIGSGAIGRGNYGISIGVGAQVGNLSGADRTINVGPETSISGSYSTNFGAANTINCERGIILGTTNNLTSPYSAIIGSNHNISSTGYYNTILGGFGNVISGATSGTTLIGLSGYTGPLQNDTAYVKNLKVLGQAQSNSNNVGSVSSGTTLDFNTGNIQYFQLTSGSTIVLDATNYKDGATYIVKVKQPTSGTNATMTFTSPLFKFPNGVSPTLSTGNDEEDILSFICIGTTLYGNIQKTFI